MHNDEKVPEPLYPGTVAVAVNRSMLYLAALTVAAVVFFASFYPRPLFLATVSSLLTICAIAAAVAASLRLQRPASDHLTLWDVSAVLMFVALGAGILTDPASVEAYLKSLAAAETAPGTVDAV
jgi:predicted Kef-type K+ transport protein